MPQLDPTIRRARLEDVDTLAEFNRKLAYETEGESLDRQTVQLGVRRGMEKGDEVVYYVAELNAEPVGALMLTREWSDWRNGWMIWLQSVYVRSEFRGQGVFQNIMNHVIHVLSETPDVVGLRLYVETENTRAQAVYTRLGFTESSYRILERQFDETG